MKRPGNKLLSFMLMLVWSNAYATKSLKLPVELKVYHLESGEDCPSELGFTLVPDGADQVLIASPTISFPFLIARSGVDDEDQTSCRYETKVTLTDAELTKTVTISKCPNKEPVRQITETLVRSKDGLSYTHVSGDTKKLCRYRP